MYDNTIENSPEAIKPYNEEDERRAAEWGQAMSDPDVPEFAGEGVGLFGGTTEAGAEGAVNGSREYDEQLNGAASLINYGLDAAARQYGVEAVVQGIKTFDGTGSENPIGDLFNHLGVDTREEAKDIHDTNRATKTEGAFFREQNSMPASVRRSDEGAFKAIEDMKELISEVEGADPAYDELRAAAKQAGMGYFEYAVHTMEKRGLTDLFGALKEFKNTNTAEKEDDSEKEEKTVSETEEKTERLF